MAQLTSEFLQSIGQGSGEDPLVEIRKTELALKDKELNMDAEQKGILLSLSCSVLLGGTPIVGRLILNSVSARANRS